MLAVETLGWHYFWFVLAIVGVIVVLIAAFAFFMFAAEDGEWGGALIGTVLLAVAGFCVFTIVHQQWTMDRITCQREAVNYDTQYRWTKALGCYLRDDSGRYIPDDAYNTTRIERGQP